ncbi:MAG: putative MerR family transcriptional regulator [Acidimicrobiales bacterium]|nr:putative MerR family transcriptional regulator [Acidimicrobiales bacterium]
MADAPHLSIGEVLSLLQDEFPDVTISKIRFLESQGLIDPERTPSGYRKFYEADIDRLRWILTQQREHFLPLKVIKDRLEAANGGVPVGDGDDPAREPAVVAAATRAPATVSASMPAGEAPDQPVPIWMADLVREPVAAAPVASSSRARRGTKVVPIDPLDQGPTSVSLTAAELAVAAGIDEPTLRELERYGLIQGRPMGTDTFYDGDALVIAQRSATFLQHGIEARHLRMFKVSAEREAGFLEQVVMPLLKQRNPAAREQAVALLGELAGLGQELRAALLRSNLREHLHPG